MNNPWHVRLTMKLEEISRRFPAHNKECRMCGIAFHGEIDVCPKCDAQMMLRDGGGFFDAIEHIDGDPRNNEVGNLRVVRKRRAEGK